MATSLLGSVLLHETESDASSERSSAEDSEEDSNSSDGEETEESSSDWDVTSSDNDSSDDTTLDIYHRSHMTLISPSRETSANPAYNNHDSYYDHDIIGEMSRHTSYYGASGGDYGSIEYSRSNLTASSPQLQNVPYLLQSTTSHYNNHSVETQPIFDLQIDLGYYLYSLFYPYTNYQALLFSQQFVYKKFKKQKERNYDKDDEDEDEEDEHENTEMNMDWNNIKHIERISGLLERLLKTAGTKGIEEISLYQMFSSPSPSRIIYELRFGIFSNLCICHLDRFGNRTFYYSFDDDQDADKYHFNADLTNLDLFHEVDVIGLSDFIQDDGTGRKSFLITNNSTESLALLSNDDNIHAMDDEDDDDFSVAMIDEDEDDDCLETPIPSEINTIFHSNKSSPTATNKSLNLSSSSTSTIKDSKNVAELTPPVVMNDVIIGNIGDIGERIDDDDDDDDDDQDKDERQENEKKMIIEYLSRNDNNDHHHHVDNPRSTKTNKKDYKKHQKPSPIETSTHSTSKSTQSIKSNTRRSKKGKKSMKKDKRSRSSTSHRERKKDSLSSSASSTTKRIRNGKTKVLKSTTKIVRTRRIAKSGRNEKRSSSSSSTSSSSGSADSLNTMLIRSKPTNTKTKTKLPPTKTHTKTKNITNKKANQRFLKSDVVVDKHHGVTFQNYGIMALLQQRRLSTNHRPHPQKKQQQQQRNNRQNINQQYRKNMKNDNNGNDNMRDIRTMHKRKTKTKTASKTHRPRKMTLEEMAEDIGHGKWNTVQLNHQFLVSGYIRNIANRLPIFLTVPLSIVKLTGMFYYHSSHLLLISGSMECKNTKHNQLHILGISNKKRYKIKLNRLIKPKPMEQIQKDHHKNKNNMNHNNKEMANIGKTKLVNHAHSDTENNIRVTIPSPTTSMSASSKLISPKSKTPSAKSRKTKKKKNTYNSMTVNRKNMQNLRYRKSSTPTSYGQSRKISIESKAYSPTSSGSDTVNSPKKKKKKNRTKSLRFRDTSNKTKYLSADNDKSGTIRSKSANGYSHHTEHKGGYTKKKRSDKDVSLSQQFDRYALGNCFATSISLPSWPWLQKKFKECSIPIHERGKYAVIIRSGGTFTYNENVSTDNDIIIFNSKHLYHTHNKQGKKRMIVEIDHKTNPLSIIKTNPPMELKEDVESPPSELQTIELASPTNHKYSKRKKSKNKTKNKNKLKNGKKTKKTKTKKKKKKKKSRNKKKAGYGNKVTVVKYAKPKIINGYYNKLPSFRKEIEYLSVIYNEYNSSLFCFGGMNIGRSTKSILQLKLNCRTTRELKWRKCASLNKPRYSCSLVNCGYYSNQIGVIGGMNSNAKEIRNVELYNICNRQSQVVASLNEARANCGACFISDLNAGTIVVGGGVKYGDASKQIEIYDFHKNKWNIHSATTNYKHSFPTLWNDQINPNIIYIAGDNIGISGGGRDANLGFIEWCDLRESNRKNFNVLYEDSIDRLWRFRYTTRNHDNGWESRALFCM